MSAGIPFDEVSALLEDLKGERVRVTWPNGCRKSGLVSIRPIGPRLYPFHDGDLVGGEYDGAVKIERMAPNGRYEGVR
jgi:hypothetical protein